MATIPELFLRISTRHQPPAEHVTDGRQLVKRRELLISLAAAVLVGDSAEQALRQVGASPPRSELAAPSLVAGTNVRSHPFNAAGNGSADDTAAFAKACGAAGANGTVVVPPGTYILDNLLLNKAGQQWVIQSGAILKSKAASTDPALRVTAVDVAVTGGGIIDGNRANHSAGNPSGIVCAAANFTLDDITVQHCLAYGVLFTGAWTGATVTRCHFTDCGSPAICSNGSTANVTSVSVSGNRIDQYDTAGRSATSQAPTAIMLWNSDSYEWTDFAISGNQFRCYPYVSGEYNSCEALVLRKVAGFTITGNVFSSGGFGISLPSSVRGTVAGNYIAGWSVYGLELSSDTVVRGNVFEDTDPRSPTHHSGPSIITSGTGVQGVVISGNHIRQPATAINSAVQIWPDSVGGIHHINFTGNTVRKLGSGGVIVANKCVQYLTIADNIFDCGGVSNTVIQLVTDNSAHPITLVGQMITGNQFLNYGAGAAILYGNSGRLADPAVDYAVFANNVFRKGSRGIAAQDNATLGPHTVSSGGKNVGP